jgi:hypothetical protein
MDKRKIEKWLDTHLIEDDEVTLDCMYIACMVMDYVKINELSFKEVETIVLDYLEYYYGNYVFPTRLGKHIKKHSLDYEKIGFS